MIVNINIVCSICVIFFFGYYMTEPNILFDLSKSNFISRNCMSQDSYLDPNYKKESDTCVLLSW